MLANYTIQQKRFDESGKQLIGADSDIATRFIGIQEYRSILNDNKSTDEQIEKRLQYLETFCRSIIRSEINQLKNE